jgi:hypothetical protein
MPNDNTSQVEEETTQNNTPKSEASGLSREGLAALLDNAIPALSGSIQAGTSEPVSDSGEIQSERDDNQGLNSYEDVSGSAGEDVSSEGNSGEEAESEEQESEEDEVESLPKGVKKRISKLNAKRKEAEEALRKAQDELEELRKSFSDPKPSASKDNNPFGHITREEDLSSAANKARQVRDWVEENPYGGTITKSDGTEIEVDEREARRMKVQAMRDLEVNIPLQLSNIQARRKFDPLAEETYPWWKKKESTEYKTAQALIQNFPELAKFPDYKLVVGDFIFGMTARQARQAKSAPQNKAPFQPSRPSASPMSQPKNIQKAQEVEKRFNKTRSRDDLASLIEARYFG